MKHELLYCQWIEDFEKISLTLQDFEERKKKVEKLHFAYINLYMSTCIYTCTRFEKVNRTWFIADETQYKSWNDAWNIIRII